MGDSSMETGDVKIGSINSSLGVLCCGISVVFKSIEKIAPIAKVDFSEGSSTNRRLSTTTSARF